MTKRPQHGPAPAVPLPTALRRSASVLLGAGRAVALDVVAALAAGAEFAADRRQGRTPAPASVPVHVLILADDTGTPVAEPSWVRAALLRADAAFTGAAGIRVRHTGTTVLRSPAPAGLVDSPASRRLMAWHLAGRTDYLLRQLPTRPALGVVGDPITVVVTRSLAGNTTACSLGASADWVLCEASLFDPSQPRRYDETVLAHELGHAMNLPHHRDRTNLMYPTSSPPGKVRGTRLHRWQAAVLRANRHVIPPTRPAV